jgi:hypothetical protein
MFIKRAPYGYFCKISQKSGGKVMFWLHYTKPQLTVQEAGADCSTAGNLL